MSAVRETIRDIVDDIRPGDQLEGDHRRAALAWIDTGAVLCRTQKPVTPPVHLVSYVVLYDAEGSVLLLKHIKSGRLLPPGGHVEPGEHPYGTACRELWEELGIATGDDYVPAPHFLSLNSTVGPDSHTDVCLWYVALDSRTRPDVQVDEREAAEAAWFFPEDVLGRADTDPAMDRFLSKAAMV